MSKRKHWWNRNKRIPCVKCDAKGRDHLGPCPWCIGRGYRMRYIAPGALALEIVYRNGVLSRRLLRQLQADAESGPKERCTTDG